VTSPDFDHRAQARVGTTLNGKYRIDSVLGIGGMAVVYAATHRNQKRFAVKMLHRELSLEGDIHARFLREGYAANTVNHPGAVAVLDDDVAEDGAAFLVMELLEGQTVDGLSERCEGRLPLHAALGIAYQTLDVLEAAHKSAIVHRDIKPANLFLMRDGRVKVLDFGIARLRDATASHLATRTGAMLGTPAFMAPEQALGEVSEVGPQTDVWAVGATLFTLISGALVHEATNPSQLLVRAATMPPRSLSAVAPDTPAPVVDLVAQALAFDRAARWPTAAAMREAIERVHQELFGEGPRPERLGALFGTPSAPPGPPRDSKGPPPRDSQGPPVRASHRPATMTAAPPMPAASARPAAPPIATTTAKPVSAGAAGDRVPTAASQRGPWGWMVAAGIFVAAGGGAMAFHFVAPPRGDPPPSARDEALPHGADPARPSATTPVAPSTDSSSRDPSAGNAADADAGAALSVAVLPPKAPAIPAHPVNTVRLPAPPPAATVAPTVDRNPLRMPLQ
jgi:eukaryotic-like serine/threonine-protein kinase